MKKFKITKILSLALATVIAVSTFTINSFAMSDTAKAHKRDLTAEEISCLKSMFDADYYATVYLDVVDTLGTNDADTMFLHFVTFGLWEQRQPSASFNVDVYASRNADLQEAYGDDIVAYYVHYATHKYERTWRTIPTLEDAYYKQATIYSVYDFVKGQKGPVDGAYPVQSVNNTPNLKKLVEQTLGTSN